MSEILKENELLSQLVAMSRSLGDPANDYVILGEGNTSAKVDADSFWVKASGTELRTITVAPSSGLAGNFRDSMVNPIGDYLDTHTVIVAGVTVPEPRLPPQGL